VANLRRTGRRRLRYRHPAPARNGATFRLRDTLNKERRFVPRGSTKRRSKGRLRNSVSSTGGAVRERDYDSTVGAGPHIWKLQVWFVEREIRLWDFGGQADQRLIHQLYLEDTALAALVFDGQRKTCSRRSASGTVTACASRKTLTNLLVAGRVDAGGLRVGRSQVETFVKERGFACFLPLDSSNSHHFHRVII
jgi:hypothetical protein